MLPAPAPQLTRIACLAQGHKRWFLTPGTAVPLPVFPADNIPIRTYNESLFMMLEPADQPQHCVQGPHDLLCKPQDIYR